MSNILNSAKLAPALVFAILSLVSTGSFAYVAGCPDTGASPLNGCSLPETVKGSFPYFYQDASVKYKGKKNNDNFSMKARLLKGSDSSFLYASTNDVLDITKTKLNFKANIKDGVASGKIKIKGAIDELGLKKSVLMTAELEGVWEVDGTLIGFNTTNIVCNDAINAYVGGCTTDEVVYFNLQDAIGPNAGSQKIKTTGIAVTSVPVPAAAWLFGSGLIGLAGTARRRWSD